MAISLLSVFFYSCCFPIDNSIRWKWLVVKVTFILSSFKLNWWSSTLPSSQCLQQDSTTFPWGSTLAQSPQLGWIDERLHLIWQLNVINLHNLYLSKLGRRFKRNCQIKKPQRAKSGFCRVIPVRDLLNRRIRRKNLDDCLWLEQGQS